MSALEVGPSEFDEGDAGGVITGANAAVAAGFGGDAWITVVGFDPGVTTGWAWYSLPVERLLRTGPESVGRRLRSGEYHCGQFERKAAKEAGARVGVGFVNWENYQVDSMRALLTSVWEKVDHDPSIDLFFVVVEDFILRLSTKDRSLLAPVRITAAFEYAMKDVVGSGAVPLVKFAPGDAKRVVTDERLKRWGLYEAGSDHARDARRHSTLFLRKWASDLGFRRMYS